MTRTGKHRFRSLCGAAGAVSLALTPAFVPEAAAQAWPTKPSAS